MASIATRIFLSCRGDNSKLGLTAVPSTARPQKTHDLPIGSPIISSRDQTMGAGEEALLQLHRRTFAFPCPGPRSAHRELTQPRAGDILGTTLTPAFYLPGVPRTSG